METFTKLFGSLVAFVYHCFDRIVILGYLPLLTRPENIVYFFRDLHQVGAITKKGHLGSDPKNEKFIVRRFERSPGDRISIPPVPG